VAVIDSNAEAFRRLGEGFKGVTVEGVGFDREVLEAAGIRKAGGFAAVSSGDNSNILAARVVREIYRVENVVARIYDQGRAAVYERLGIPTVATVKWTVLEVLRRLLPEGSMPVWRDPTGDAKLLQMHVHNGWVGRRISELSQAADCPIPFVLRVGRGIVPDRDTIYQDGDLIYVACMTEKIDDTESLFAHPPVRA
ncbi:MAG: TrkA family potassium uptake protein, partial [Propionibacteriaceae bacterium]|nr:TrkA family potassium uptake protein [Propionibacteriaceae bacterium]